MDSTGLSFDLQVRHGRLPRMRTRSHRKAGWHVSHLGIWRGKGGRAEVLGHPWLHSEEPGVGGLLGPSSLGGHIASFMKNWLSPDGI